MRIVRTMQNNSCERMDSMITAKGSDSTHEVKQNGATKPWLSMNGFRNRADNYKEAPY